MSKRAPGKDEGGGRERVQEEECACAKAPEESAAFMDRK